MKKNKKEFNINSFVYYNFLNKKNFFLFITNSAIIYIYNKIYNDFFLIGLQILIDHKGCAGLIYFLKKKIIFKKNNILYKYKYIKLYINNDKIFYVNGLNIYLKKEYLNFFLKFYNSRAQHYCGCGESFKF